MALRLLQIHLPNDEDDAIAHFFLGHEVLSRVEDSRGTGAVDISLIVSAGDAEKIMDALESRFGKTPEFHVVLAAVEAVLPRRDEPPKIVHRISREELYGKVSDGAWALRVDPSLPEISVRSRVGLSDIILVLAAGAAGTLAFTTALPAAVIGVMVAVALMPPLVVAGLLLGSGHTSPAAGALLLAATNVVCVNLAGVATFLLQGVRPRRWWDTERAKEATRRAIGLWVLALLALAILVIVISPE